MFEGLFGVALGKLLGKALDWLLPNRRRRGSEGSQPAVVVNTGVPPEFAEQSTATARQLGRMETENALLRSENAELRKAHDAVIAELQQRSRKANDPSRFNQALAELEKGHPEAAEALFRDFVMENRREAARAASNIGVLAFRHDTQKALCAYEEAVELDSNNADAWMGIGYLQSRMGNLEEAESAFGKLLDLGNKKDDDALRADALSGIGSVFGIRGEWDMAKDKLMAALKLNEKLGSQEGMARNYGDIGNVDLSRGNLAGAVEMYRKSLALNEDLGNMEIVLGLCGNLGVVLEKIGDLAGAEKMHRKSLVISEEAGDKEGIANAYGNLGGIFMIRGSLSRAEEILRKSLGINEDMGRKESMAINYTNLGTISEAQGDVEEACRLWKKARDIFTDMGARKKVEDVEQMMHNAGCPS